VGAQVLAGLALDLVDVGDDAVEAAVMTTSKPASRAWQASVPMTSSAS
jgi:hypothetical protein